MICSAFKNASVHREFRDATESLQRESVIHVKSFGYLAERSLDRCELENRLPAKMKLPD